MRVVHVLETGEVLASTMGKSDFKRFCKARKGKKIFSKKNLLLNNLLKDCRKGGNYDL